MIPIFAVVFFSFFGYAMITVIFMPMLLNPDETFLPKDTPVSTRATMAGILLAAYPLGQFIGAPVLGALSDRYGRKPLLLITLGLTIVMYANIALALQVESYAWLVAACFVCGLGEANIALAQSALADVSSAAERGKVFSYIFACVSGAYLTGPVFGGQLAAYFGYDVPFWIMLGPLGLGWLGVLALFRETHPPDPSKPLALGRSFANLRYVITDASLRPIYLLNLLAYTSAYGFYRVVTFFMVHKWRMSVDTMTLWYAGFAAAVTVANLGIMPRLTKHVSLVKITITSCVGAGALMMLMPWPPAAVVAIAVLGYPASVFAGMLLPGASGFISTQADDQRQGQVMGNNQALQVGGEAGGAALGGVLASVWMPLPLMAYGGSLFVTGLGYLPYRKR